MNVAIDISPLQTGHKVRGVGFYLKHLKDALEKNPSECKFSFFTQTQNIPDAVDIVHYPYFEPFFRTINLSKKIKTIITVHDLTPIIFREHFPPGIKGTINWHIQRYALSKVDAIITDSENSKKDIVKYIGIDEKKVHVVYLAGGEEFTVIKTKKSEGESIRKKYKLPDKFALYVGDVTWNKNVPRIIHAAQIANIPLVMVGKALINKDYDKTNPWNKDLVEIQELVRNDKNITTLGFISTEELVTIYNIATLFVMPSLYEGFGLPLIEAMQCGCPVVTSNLGSVPEVTGDAAYQVDGYSVESIADGIKEVFADEKLQKQLSEKGLAQAKKFSWKKTAQETMNVYKKVYETKNS